MILREKDDREIELVSFELMRENEEVRNAYFLWLEDLSVTRLIASESLLLPKAKKLIESSFERLTQRDAIGFFIYHVQDDKFIGTAKLDQISFFKRSGWDGIMIGDPEYRGRGVAYKVYRMLLAYGFHVLGLNKVNGGCNEHNKPMIKTFEKLGYQLEGRLRCCDYIEGQYSDHLYYGILRDEFNNKHKVKLNL